MDMWDHYEVGFVLLEPMLGTIPKHAGVWSEHVRTHLAGDDEAASAARLADEAGETERGWTGFHTDAEGRPIIYDYQIKGALKEAGNTLKDALGLRALRAAIEREVFVNERTLVLGDDVDGFIERPLRAMTMQGPRVTVVRSDKIDPGQTYTFTVRVLKKSRVTRDVLKAVFAYWEQMGLGQWRSGGYGRARVWLDGEPVVTE